MNNNHLDVDSFIKYEPNDLAVVYCYTIKNKPFELPENMKTLSVKRKDGMFHFSNEDNNGMGYIAIVFKNKKEYKKHIRENHEKVRASFYFSILIDEYNQKKGSYLFSVN